MSETETNPGKMRAAAGAARWLPLWLVLAFVGGCTPADGRPSDVAVAEEAQSLSGPTGETRPCRIVRVIDGDTVVCAENERVRLLLIDTPERDQQPFGGLATQALETLLADQPEVRLEQDIEARDQYDRTLAYIWLEDGRLVNEEMARSGYAVSIVYPPNVRHIDRIRAAVDEAREAQRGLWSTDAFDCLPVDHRAGRCQ